MEGLKERLKGIYRQIIEEGSYKFLGFFEKSSLRFLEELLDTDLGIRGREEKGREPRKGRPFIGKKRGNLLEVCFLTEKARKYLINLDNCKKEDSSCNWIKNESYIFYDRKRGYAKFVFKNLDGLDYVLCGRCEDLEVIDKLRVFEI